MRSVHALCRRALTPVARLAFARADSWGSACRPLSYLPPPRPGPVKTSRLSVQTQIDKQKHALWDKTRSMLSGTRQESACECWLVGLWVGWLAIWGWSTASTSSTLSAASAACQHKQSVGTDPCIKTQRHSCHHIIAPGRLFMH